MTDPAMGHQAALVAAEKDQGGEMKTSSLGSRKGHSVRGVVETMERVSGREIAVVEVRRREGDVAACVADPRRAERDLGWRTVKMMEDCCVDICRLFEV